MTTFGYAGKILKVDLSSRKITEVPTADYATDYVGGRGIAARIYWDETPPDISAFDPENRLIFATGPLMGLPVISGSRWCICGKSALHDPESFNYCNLGGNWGAELKFSGYDALVVHGRAEKPTYLFIHDGTVEFRDASSLWGRGSLDTNTTLKDELGKTVKVVAIGPGGENRAVMATIGADKGSSGGGGLGATMGSKNLKAIAVQGERKRVTIAQPERFKELADSYRNLPRVKSPLHAFMWSPDPVGNIPQTPPGVNVKKDVCYGCLGCDRVTYEAKDGKKGKFLCNPALFYQPAAQAYYGEFNDVPFYAAQLCDEYGLDSEAIIPLIHWMNLCHRKGILTDESTGIPISKVGSIEFLETMLRKLSFREGFGDLLAQGLFKAAKAFGPKSEDYAERAYFDAYSPRLYIVNQLIYAMSPRFPVQELHQTGLIIGKWLSWARKMEGGVVSNDSVRAIAKRFWGSEAAADMTTCEGKALAAKMIQDREYAKECLIVCDFKWPIIDLSNTKDHVGDPGLESRVLSAVTGNEWDEEGLLSIGERVFNLQRAILVRERRQGRSSDSLPELHHTRPFNVDFHNIYFQVPGKGDEVVSRKGAVVDREQFEKMKSEYYQLRRWDVDTGLQTISTLNELGLEDIGMDLKQRGLAI